MRMVWWWFGVEGLIGGQTIETLGFECYVVGWVLFKRLGIRSSSGLKNYSKDGFSRPGAVVV